MVVEKMEMRPVRNAGYNKTAEIQGPRDRSEGSGGGGVGESLGVKSQRASRAGTCPGSEWGDWGPCERETTEEKRIWGEDSGFSFSITCKLGPVSR